MSIKMKIKSTTYQHKDIYKGTWITLNKKTVNQIDYLLTQMLNVKSVQNVRFYRGANVDSNNFITGIELKQIISTSPYK